MTEDFGAYNPSAKGHAPYHDAMSEWRNQVRAMQQSGVIAGSPEAAVAASEQPAAPEQPSAPPEDAEEPQKPAEDAPQLQQRTMEEALDLNADGTFKEGDHTDAPEEPSEPEPNEPESTQELPEEVYDPAEHNAPEVMDYLKGLGRAEAERVLESEEAGKNRKGIMNLRDDILAKAQANDEANASTE